jgi:hypothetical protein
MLGTATNSAATAPPTIEELNAAADQSAMTDATVDPFADASFATDAGAIRPRLMIKKMVLENFKSYAGRVEVGPFHKVRSTGFGHWAHSKVIFVHRWPERLWQVQRD